MLYDFILYIIIIIIIFTIIYYLYYNYSQPKVQTLNIKKNYNKSKIAIITATQNDDIANIRSIDHLNADGYIFTRSKNLTINGNKWKTIIKQYYYNVDPLKIIKYYKTQWHKIDILKKYNTIIWIDPSVELLSIPIISEDIIVYNHGIRNNVYDEIDASYNHHLYLKYQEQLDYQKEIYVNINWLAITCFVVYNRTRRTIKNNNIWFKHIIKYSPIDQVSLPIACTESNVNISLLVASNSHIRTPHYINHNDLNSGNIISGNLWTNIINSISS